MNHLENSIWNLGSGTFDNDAAMDFVQNLVLQVRKGLCPPTVYDDIKLVLAAVALYRILIEHCCVSPPTRDEIVSLRDATLNTFDLEHFEGLAQAESWIKKRRPVIASEFELFLGAIAKLEPET